MEPTITYNYVATPVMTYTLNYVISSIDLYNQTLV